MNRTEILLTVVWVILALGTLALVINDGHALLTAITAWVGGVLTCFLFQRIFPKEPVSE